MVDCFFIIVSQTPRTDNQIVDSRLCVWEFRIRWKDGPRWLQQTVWWPTVDEKVRAVRKVVVWKETPVLKFEVAEITKCEEKCNRAVKFS